MKKLLAVGVIVLFLSVSVIPSTGTIDVKQITMPTAKGDILYVGGNGTGNYTKIQDAINDANDGDTVFVYNGTYEENLVIDNSIKLIGENKENTIIDGDNKEKWINVIEIKSNNVKISSFTIKGSLNGVYIAGDYANITNNIILKNNHYGIHSYRSSYHNINNNLISNTLRGIHLDVSHHNNINDNTLSNNENGINLQFSVNNTVINNNFYSDGIEILGSKIKHWNSHIIENNFANGRPIKYYKNLEDILIQNNATQVILANCTSVMLNGLNTSGVDTGIQLGFSKNCIISNSISSNNNYKGITFINSSNNIIDNNNFSNNDIGIDQFHHSSYNIISNNTLTNNKRYSIEISGKNTTIVGNNFISNIKGIYLSYASGLIISDNYFYDNIGDSIYTFTEVSNCQIIDNEIIGNNDNGMSLQLSGSNLISRNKIQDNNGVGIYVHSTDCILDISNNVIENNTQGIKMSYVDNCTITMNNIIDNIGRGISVIYNYNTQVKNNNLEGNNPNAYFQCSGSHYIDGGRISGFLEGVRESLKITFDGNYWGRTRLFPVLIKGKIISFGDPSWIGDIEYQWWKFDWHPASEPYDIPYDMYNISIPLSEIGTDAKFFSYNSNEVDIKFFAVLGSDYDVHIAFDACDICYSAKKGYTQMNDMMRCNNCGNTYLINSIGGENPSGGCWPSYLPMRIDGDNVIIKIFDLEEKRYMFI